jgi:hypothetical protein
VPWRAAGARLNLQPEGERMPVLNWIGKDAVVRHDADVPFRLLQDAPELGCGDADGGNLIVEGDNL